MLTVLGGLAEFERELILARTSDGREPCEGQGCAFWPAAVLIRTSGKRRSGNPGGRPRVVGARQYTIEAISTLAAIMRDPKAPAAARVVFVGFWAARVPSVQRFQSKAPGDLCVDGKDGPRSRLDVQVDVVSVQMQLGRFIRSKYEFEHVALRDSNLLLSLVRQLAVLDGDRNADRLDRVCRDAGRAERQQFGGTDRSAGR